MDDKEVTKPQRDPITDALDAAQQGEIADAKAAGEAKEPEKPPVLTIRETIKDQLGKLGDRTREQVIEHFAAKEADKQAQAMIKGLDKLSELEKDLRKIRPSHTGYGEDGKPVGDPVFSKDQVDQRKKLNEQIAKLTKALNKADDENDFQALYDAVNKG